MSNELKINLASGVEEQLNKLNETLSKYLPMLVEALNPKPRVIPEGNYTIEEFIDQLKTIQQPAPSEDKTPEPFSASAEVATPAPAAEPAPAPAAEPAPTADPVPEAPKYTKEQVMKAGADLLENRGMMTQLIDILARHGSHSLSELPDEKLNDVAAELIKLGADL